jgi:hypothetical protein
MGQGASKVAASNNLILRTFSHVAILIIVACRILIHECRLQIYRYSSLIDLYSTVHQRRRM